MKKAFPMNSSAHFMKPGTVAFVPGWIILFIVILSVGMLFPEIFKYPKNQEASLNPAFLAFIIGSLMPIFDDLLAFIIGKPFAHHCLFHSLIGSFFTYIFFLILAPNVVNYAFFGNLTHIFFNFYLDRVTLLFPFSYREFGLTDFIGLSTYNLKVIHYPLIFLMFGFSVLKFFLQ